MTSTLKIDIPPTDFSPAAESRNLELAFLHTEHTWFPPDEEKVSALRQKLYEGLYSDKQQLLNDLKSDFSLYLICLRGLRSLLESEGKGGRNPSLGAIFRRLTPETLFSILEVDKTPSEHRFSAGSEYQTSRAREAALSVSTAELLAERFNLEPGLGYTCALMRQLGLTLIAWNYPTVYRKTLENLSASGNAGGADLDMMLHHTLGFSPAMLGLRFGREWGLPEEVLEVVDEHPHPNTVMKQLGGTNTTTMSKSELLVNICTIGEALARANNPQLYPTARNDWKHAKKVIERYLGKDGIREIYRKASHWSPPLEEGQADPFSEELLQSSHEAGAAHVTALLERNIFLRACHPTVQQELLPIYMASDPRDVKHETIRRLIHQAIPRVGFNPACIFMLDPTSVTLAPVLKTGNPLFIKLRPLVVDDSSNDTNPIRLAFNRSDPSEDEGLLLNGEKRRFFCGALGEQKPIGVLYLELSETAPRHVQNNPLLVFKALLQCLNDILHLH